MSKYYKDLRRAMIKDLKKIKRYNALIMWWWIGYLDGYKSFVGLTKSESKKLEILIKEHFKKNYNWLGRLKE